MPIISKKPGWAEQQPEMWYKNLVEATRLLKKNAGKKLKETAAIGISYQMHGLVLVDRSLKVLRPSIIWCDSRAVSYGERARKKIGPKRCLERLLNYPGNFTASKLMWVIDNEPEIYGKAHKFMLPGEYIAMRLTGEIVTTIPGLAEEMLWDYKAGKISDEALAAAGIRKELVPDVLPTFGVQGMVTAKAASELGIKAGIPVAYRAGDQPNNALSLNVMEPGETAATAGTSGVIFGITDKPLYDKRCRVNTFSHVGSSAEKPRNGVMVCVNGTGILNSWLKSKAGGVDYNEMNRLAALAGPGSAGLMVYPYGNGAERTLENRDIGARIEGLKFNTHGRAHLFRAGQEGIVFALNYGFEVMKSMGMKIDNVRAGHANMFLSPVFREVFASTCGVTVELFDTDGSQGAARGAGLGAGIFRSRKEMFKGLKRIDVIGPDAGLSKLYAKIYGIWKKNLNGQPEK